MYKYQMSSRRANVEKALKEFGQKVYRAARLKGKSRGEPNLEVFPNSFFLEFDLKPHEIFQDRGVSGTKVKYATPFRYKTKQPPISAIEPWVRRGRFQFRNKRGQFTSYRSTAFLVARAIKRRGIRPTGFFSKPFERYFRELPDDIVEAYGLELDEVIDLWIDRPNLKDYKK